MANIKSAQKRARQAVKRRAHNVSLHTAARSAIKDVKKAIAAGDKKAAAAALVKSQAVIDRVAASLELGMGKVAQPLRVALTGTAVSPSIDKTLWLMGKQRSLAGLAMALDFIEARSAAQ